MALHLRVSSEHVGSPSGWPVFRVACGRWYILAACVDRPELVTCKRCLKASREV